MFFIRLVGVMALAALNGFFAATEFSLVAVRISRVRQLVARGSASARIVRDLLGELVPKTVSLARAERVALLVARPFRWFLNTFRWAIDLLEGISGLIVKALGVSTPSGHGVAHSTEELQMQIQQARERGLLAAGE